MRKKIAAANWKMNLTFQQGKDLVNGILVSDLNLKQNQQVVICPAFPYLVGIKELIGEREGFYLGAQNCASEKSGAYTGEISPEMLQSVGVTYAIIGHSERREYYGETNEILKKKILLALEYGLKPLFCCGEPLDIREKNAHNAFVEQQLKESLFDLTENEMNSVVIAYEPIWAIGTGRTATPDQAQEMHAFIRAQIVDRYGTSVAEETSILYGGSCKPDNAEELFNCPDVDGALIGGASLKAESFSAIASCLR